MMLAFPCFQLQKCTIGPKMYMKHLPDITFLWEIALKDVTLSLVGREWVHECDLKQSLH